MSYRGRSNGSYANHHNPNRTVASVQNSRSLKAKLIDAGLKAPIAKAPEQWMNAPNRFDLHEVDDPKTKELAAKIEAKGSVAGSTATYNKATGWMSISFSDIPSSEVRSEMKSLGFRYNPVRKQWVAKWYPSREALAKKFSGSVEQVDIKPNWAAKAEHAAELAAKHESLSSVAHAEADRIGDLIPFGQPVLVGHHSERHHRRDLERIENKIGKAIEENKIAESYAEKAARYGEKATGEKPDVIFRRIKKLEAEERKMLRRLNDSDYSRTPADKEHFNKWLNHYRQRLDVEREKYRASGGIPTDKFNLKQGDRVRTKHGLGTVGLVSEKTLRVLLDPFENGRPRWIYANAKGESLLSKDDIVGKI